MLPVRAPEIVSDNTTDDLKIVMGEFEGPLDLLLHLIRQEQVNIYDIPVARIADEYLRYLQLMQDMDIAVAGDFLVMAATLDRAQDEDAAAARSFRGGGRRRRSAQGSCRSIARISEIQSGGSDALVAGNGRARRFQTRRNRD